MATEMALAMEEKSALTELRVAIHDVIKERQNFDNDRYLMKWLRARKFNVSKTEKMIRQSITFRNEHSLDDMDKWKMPEVLEKYLPYGIFGEDIDGHPVIYLRIGSTDLKGLTQCTSKADLLRYMEYQAQDGIKRCEMLSQKYGRHIDQCVFVVDLEGFSLQTHFNTRTLSYLKALIRSAEENYPELTRIGIMLTNSPVFHLCWEVISHFIDEGSKNKIHFIRPNEYEDKLTGLIPKEHLPACYGGGAFCPDRFCSSAVNMGGIVPENYYLKNTTRSLDPDLTLLTVRPRSTAVVPVEVPEAGSVLYWIFKTEHYDINFSIHFQPLPADSHAPSEPKCVLSSQRYDSHLVPEQSYLMCQQRGRYSLHFDNSFSWIHAKQVRYFFNVAQTNVSFD